MDEDFNPTATEIAMGWLGSTASFTHRVARDRGFVRAFVQGDVVVIVTSGEQRTRVEARKADGALVGQFDLAAPPGSLGDVLVDAARSQIYASVALPGGGVEIRRIAFNGGRDSAILALDERFTADPFPTERFGFTRRADGVLVVLACARRDGCRLWQVRPDDAAAGDPVNVKLPETSPIACSVVGATDEWLVVYDDDACFVDTGEAPLPLRAISLRDGSSRLIAEDHILAGRVMELGGRSVVAASLRSDDWSTSEILLIDVETGERRTFVRDLRNSEDGSAGWLGASPLPLVPDWLLIVPWGVDLNTRAEPPNARLLNLSTEDLMELPPGTFGWD